MFNKLRNKFLILIMAVTSLVLITAFSVVYTITYKNIQNQNMEALSKSSLFSDFLPSLLIPSDYKPSFTLLLDNKGNIVEKYSFIDMSSEEYNNAALKAWQNPDGNTPIRINVRLWQYTVSYKAYYTISSVQGTKSIEGYMATFLDVTESHQTLQELLITFIFVGIGTLVVVFAVSLYFANHAVKPIKMAWDAQKQFVADASHELKTPLTIINSNYGALVSKKSESIESQMKWLNYIKSGADRMDKLTSSLLYLAKADSAEFKNDTVPVDISDMVHNEINAMEAATYEKGLTFKKNIEPNIIINCDSEKVAQVVRILLDNAIKYSNENGVISICLKSEKRNIVFEIKNTGDGIAKEHLSKIFDRFYRVDTSREHDGGYGLGLPIAKAILDSVGGKITVTSEEGKSTTFSVVLAKK